MLVFFSINGYCWNSLGHRLVAQIAYDNLTEHTKKICNHYNHVLDKVSSIYSSRLSFRRELSERGEGVYTEYITEAERADNNAENSSVKSIQFLSLINAASWLDKSPHRKNVLLQPMHYIDIPFSRDGTKLKSPNNLNAVTAIKSAAEVLKNAKASDYDKSFSLRILLHVVGDIHQPMHAVTEFSANLPDGDLGGNFVQLAVNPVAKNLHAYWDNGGGWLLPKQNYPYYLFVKRQAHLLEKRWPCMRVSIDFNPQKWANESHQYAIHKAYQLKAYQKPSKSYQYMVKQLSKQQISFAGCRLAALLNEVCSAI